MGIIDNYLESQAKVKEFKGENAACERWVVDSIRNSEEKEEQRKAESQRSYREAQAHSDMLRREAEMSKRQHDAAVSETQQKLHLIKLIQTLTNQLENREQILTGERTERNRTLFFINSGIIGIKQLASNTPRLDDDTIKTIVNLEQDFNNLISSFGPSETSEVKRILTWPDDLASEIKQPSSLMADKWKVIRKTTYRTLEDVESLEQQTQAWIGETVEKLSGFLKLIVEGRNLGLLPQDNSEENDSHISSILPMLELTIQSNTRMDKIFTIELIKGSEQLEQTLSSIFEVEFNKKRDLVEKQLKEAIKKENGIENILGMALYSGIFFLVIMVFVAATIESTLVIPVSVLPAIYLAKKIAFRNSPEPPAFLSKISLTGGLLGVGVVVGFFELVGLSVG